MKRIVLTGGVLGAALALAAGILTLVASTLFVWFRM